MASLNMFFTTPAITSKRRERMVVCMATTGKKSGKSSEEKSKSSEEKNILDWVLGGMQKTDQLLETDPVLAKVEEKATTAPQKGTVSVPAPKKKSGGLGGLFAK